MLGKNVQRLAAANAELAAANAKLAAACAALAAGTKQAAGEHLARRLPAAQNGGAAGAAGGEEALAAQRLAAQYENLFAYTGEAQAGHAAQPDDGEERSGK